MEQQQKPELRGRPVGVAPVDSDATSLIAASREAKRLGIKCGTSVAEARRLCPEIVVVKASPPMYKAYHERIQEVVSNVLPIEDVHSIDEISFRLLGTERTPEVAREIAVRMKDVLEREIGPYVTCSIGIAPNVFLAKMGTELHKPDGLVILRAEDLPHRLHGLKLTDFTGINKRMQVRLNSALIFTAEQLCAASKQDLLHAFGSIVGEKWWYMLRGYDLGPERHSRKSLGHSHVLPPELRTDSGAREVMLRLLQKASARLRSEDLWTSGMVVAVSCPKRPWWTNVKLPPTQDTLTMNAAFFDAWESRDFVLPKKVGVTFYDLHKPEHVTPSLFDENYDRALLNRAVDRVNQKFGKNKIYLAAVHRAKDTAEEKIAFNKTWLFDEGKGDNAWVDTFRGHPNQ